MTNSKLLYLFNFLSNSDVKFTASFSDNNSVFVETNEWNFIAYNDTVKVIDINGIQTNYENDELIVMYI